MGGSISHMNLYSLGCVLETTSEDIIALSEIARELPRLNLDDGSFEKEFKSRGFHTSDILIFKNMSLLLDVKGERIIRIRDLCIMVCPMVSTGVMECLQLVFRCFDVDRTLLIDKDQLFEVLNLLNYSFFFSGDNKFEVSQVENFVNSIFTSGGQIDGMIRYTEFLETIAQHSLMELFLSVRFQGSWKDKVFEAKDRDKFLVSIF